MPLHAPAVATDHPHHSLGFNLGAIAALVLLVAVGAGYLVDSLDRQSRTTLPHLSDGEPIIQTIAGKQLSIPTRWFRYGEQLKAGFTNQIDLRLTMSVDDGALSVPVDVTLLPRSRARTSASLLDNVYLHQFSDDTAGGIPGLIGKPMVSTNGISSETVWYDALSPNPFVAKCMAAVSPDAPSQCVRTVYLTSGIAAIYAFDATALQSWRDFDTAMERWLTPIGAWSN